HIETSRLGAITATIADLPDFELGFASGDAIWIDSNAAGCGWFVDPTPHNDSEFTTPGNQGEQGHMDLLSVIAHEMGHVLGLDHDADPDDVMGEALAPGVRRMPTAADVGSPFGGPVTTAASVMPPRLSAESALAVILASGHDGVLFLSPYMTGMLPS